MRLTVPLMIAVGAFLVRLLFNVYGIGMEDAGLNLFPDGKDYDALAISLANGSGYELDQTANTFRPPGYPLFLAAVYSFWGHSHAAVKVVQSLMGALTCVMIMLIGERLFTRRAGVIGATMAAIYPFLIVYTGFLLSEILFVFLSTLFLYTLIRVREHYAWRWVALAGLLLGLMNLTRPAALLLPALLFFWFWIESGTKRRAALLAGTMAVWMLVPILPWTVRNYTVKQSVILIADHHWLALYAANNPKILQDPEAIGGWMEPEKVQDYRGAYLAFIRETVIHEPMQMLRLEYHKFQHFWSIFPTSSRTTYRDAITSFFSYGLLLPFSLAGMVISLRIPQKPWMLFIWILNFSLMTLILYGSTRVRAPIEPVLILFGALALEKGWQGSVGEPSGLSLQRA